MFVIEGASGWTADQVDAHLGSSLSTSIATGLRSTTWTDRVRALEEFEAMLEARTAKAIFKSDDEPKQLFEAAITVLAKTLHEKLVPVYLPAVGLLVKVFCDSILAKVPRQTVAAALEHLLPPVVLRAGSSNQRAREESAHALTFLSSSKRVGSGLVCPFVLRPVANRKSPHAAAGRIEMLHALVLKSGIDSPGLALRDVLGFILPFLESASDKTRDAAQAVLREALVDSSTETIAFIEQNQPSLVDALKKRAAQRKGEMAAMLCGDEAKENEQDGLQVVGEAVSSGRGKNPSRKADAAPNGVSSFGGLDDGKRGSPVRRRLNRALDEVEDEVETISAGGDEVETFAVHPAPSAPKKKSFQPRHGARVDPQLGDSSRPRSGERLGPLPELPELPELTMERSKPQQKALKPQKALPTKQEEWPFKTSKMEDELESILQEVNCATARLNEDDELDCILLAATRAVQACA